jgi:alpha-amylase
MVDAYARWVELTDIDGFRIDTVKHVEREFWRYFTQKLRQRLAKKGKKNFFMFGEAFDGRDNLVGAFTKNDPALRGRARLGERVRHRRPAASPAISSTASSTSPSTSGDPRRLPARPVDQAPRRSVGPAPGELGHRPRWSSARRRADDMPVNFIDNHDVPRFLFTGSREGLHNALDLRLHRAGRPLRLLRHRAGASRAATIPSNREDLWPTGFPTDGPTFDVIRRLSAIRRDSAALRRGAISVVWSSDRSGDEEDAGVFAFERAGGDAGDDYALVVFNANPSKDSAPSFNGANLTTSLPQGTELVDVLGDGQTFTVGAGGELALDPLAPQSALILVPN